MHLQRKTRLAVSGEAGQLSWLMGCLHLLWIRHACKHAHCNIRAEVSGAEWVSLAHIVLWQRPLKEHNGRCESSIPLATNHVYFAIIYWLFSRANRKIADWFPIFQPSNSFHSFFFCALLKSACKDLMLAQDRQSITENNSMPPILSMIHLHYFILKTVLKNGHWCVQGHWHLTFDMLLCELELKQLGD